MNRSTAARETTLYLVVTYLLALGVAIALPHAGINSLLTLAVPTVSVTLLTVTAVPAGSRRAVWRSFGLSRLRGNSAGVWLVALLVPLLL